MTALCLKTRPGRLGKWVWLGIEIFSPQPCHVFSERRTELQNEVEADLNCMLAL